MKQDYPISILFQLPLMHFPNHVHLSLFFVCCISKSDICLTCYYLFSVLQHKPWHPKYSGARVLTTCPAIETTGIQAILRSNSCRIGSSTAVKTPRNLYITISNRYFTLLSQRPWGRISMTGLKPPFST